MRILITGHTGFKGAWFTRWLAEQGHSVGGLALDPVAGSLYDAAGIAADLDFEVRGDIRDLDVVVDAMRRYQPEVCIHLAAQSLVRESYARPRETFETNVLGTLNVLEAVSDVASARALLVITTDKVYRNDHQIWGYRETDPLGGDDPYSASKAMADLLTQSWVKSVSGVPTAVARAGNVIGGGDVSKDRLLPDLIRSIGQGEAALVRNPAAVRPWQHVLDCLNGYQFLVQQILASGHSEGEWNFGPGVAGFVRVDTVADELVTQWSGGAAWEQAPDSATQPHEAGLLALDATKAQIRLGWRNRLDFEDAISWTVEWHKRIHAGESAREVTTEQISRFHDGGRN